MVGLLQPASREKTKTVAKDAPELLKLVEILCDNLELRVRPISLRSPA